MSLTDTWFSATRILGQWVVRYLIQIKAAATAADVRPVREDSSPPVGDRVRGAPWRRPLPE